jgi:uncharacterized membrane protein
MAAPRTSRGLDRLVNFTDASVAIAITLLILPLVDIATEVDEQPIGEVLHHNLSALISFVVTFVVIGRFWTVHHRIFEYVKAYNSRLVSANFLWLLAIVFLPFAANVLSHESGAPGISALYIGTMAIATIAAGIIDWILIHDTSLTVDEYRDRLHMGPAVISAILLVVALVVAVVFPVINLYSLLLLLLSGPLTVWWERRRYR